jgi:hypothetical protein
VGDLIPGRLGNTTEIENSVNFYNMFTHDDRDLVSIAFKKVLRLVPGVTATNFGIQPLTWQMFLQSVGLTPATTTPEGQPAPAAATGSKISMSELNKVLSIGKKFQTGKLNEDQALLLLQQYGFSEDEAKLFLQDATDGSIDGE